MQFCNRVAGNGPGQLLLPFGQFTFRVKGAKSPFRVQSSSFLNFSSSENWTSSGAKRLFRHAFLCGNGSFAGKALQNGRELGARKGPLGVECSARALQQAKLCAAGDAVRSPAGDRVRIGIDLSKRQCGGFGLTLKRQIAGQHGGQLLTRKRRIRRKLSAGPDHQPGVRRPANERRIGIV